MNPQEKKETVRQFIVSAVPSVMDLKMGCRVEVVGGISYIIEQEHYPWEENDTVRVQGDSIWWSKEALSKNHKIVGRPITLADFLVAIQVKSMGVVGLADDKFIVFDNAIKFLIYKGKWDLSQDFDHQSEAIWLFLYELLCE